MTSWPEQPAQGSTPPQTRRQARESERTAARQAHPGTSEPTPASEIPESTAPLGAGETPTIPASAFAEPGVTPPSGGGSFENLLFSVPQRPAADPSDDASAFDLFGQAPDASTPAPVTEPPSALPEAPPVAQPVAPAPAAPAPTAPAPAAFVEVAEAAPDPTGDRTLSRRELRAMLQAQAANQQVNHSPAIGEPVVPVAFTDGGAATPSVPSIAFPPIPMPADSAVTASPTSVFTAFGSPLPSAAPAAPAAGEAATRAAEHDDDTSEQEHRPFTTPTGHWSTAAELEDGAGPITSRNVGHSTAATTTNALILPSLPQADATGPLTSTGEILVTGSIDLPRTLGSSGTHDRIDSSDIDRLLDGEENEFNTSEVAPVRASRAISTHTSTRGVITPPKKRGNTLPVVLMVTAGVLAVGVIGLLIAAYVLNVF